MAYKLFYGSSGVLFDPYTDDVVTDAKLSAKVNTCDYLDFTMPITHSLFSSIEERSEDVTLYWDSTLLFRGYIEKIEQTIGGSLSVSCNGQLSRLEETLVRPYSTVDGEQPLTAPSSVDGYFAWLISQHNEHGGVPFSIGVNQGAALDANNYIYRSSEQLPTTWGELTSKITDSLGGFVAIDYGKQTINLYADVHETNAQVLDFGENIVDFTQTLDSSEVFSVIRPAGGTPDDSESSKAITIEGLPDGKTSYSSDFIKEGDHIYSASAVERYGWKEYAYSNADCKTAEGLLASACKALSNLIAPTISLSIKAVDCALYMSDYEHLKAGQAVRVRSKFHGIDEFLMVNTVELDLQDPSQSAYQLGAEYTSLTGQQSSYLRSMSANINTALDATTTLDASVKSTAKDATEAKTTASQAQSDAASAKTTATQAKTDASAAKAAAEDAQSTATQAQTDATEAKTTASQAQSDASDAKTTAQEAQADAVTAKTAAQQAQDTASAASTTATKAQTTANTAQATATQAQTDAETAQTTAQTATTTAQEANQAVETVKVDVTQAKQDAADAKSDAQTAKTTAKTAKTTAETAQSTANTAKTTANTAKTTAQEAQSTANTAQSAAETAQSTAETAQADATTAKETAQNASDKADTAQSTAINAQQSSDALKTLTEEQNKALSDELANTKTYIDTRTEVTSAWISERQDSDGNPVLTLGTDDSTYRTELSNTKLAFMDGNKEVASISNEKMDISTANIDNASIDALTIAPYQLVVRNGHFIIQYVGGES